MMIHSPATESFLKRIKKVVQKIMDNEMGLQFKRTRFLFQGSLIPLHLVCFEGNQWGHFDHHRYEIGLNKSLMYAAKNEVICNILRHELAHLITFLHWGREVPTHGKEFRSICQSYGWGKQVWSAKLDLKLANDYIEGDIGHEKIIAKVKKLLALADSDNIHEAEMATLKANQLLIQYNLSALDKDDQDTGFDELYVRKIFQIKRATSKYQAICKILQSFYVYPIFNYGSAQVTLEVTGTKENVLIAEYVAQFLDEELERLYGKSGLKGIHQKKSFMQGVAEGYELKYQQYQSQLNTQNQQGLVVIKNQLQQSIRKIYRNLTHQYITSRYDQNAKALGQISGKLLTIHKGVQNNSTPTYSLEH